MLCQKQPHFWKLHEKWVVPFLCFIILWHNLQWKNNLFWHVVDYVEKVEFKSGGVGWGEICYKIDEKLEKIKILLSCKKVANWTVKKNQVINNHDPLLTKSQLCFHSFQWGKKVIFYIFYLVLYLKSNSNTNVNVVKWVQITFLDDLSFSVQRECSPSYLNNKTSKTRKLSSYFFWRKKHFLQSVLSTTWI